MRAVSPGDDTHRADAVSEAGRRRLRLRFAEEEVHGGGTLPVPATAAAIPPDPEADRQPATPRPGAAPQASRAQPGTSAPCGAGDVFGRGTDGVSVHPLLGVRHLFGTAVTA